MSTVGQRVGPYEIAALLGQGGMGVVYKAVDTRNGSTVALKSLPRADPAALYRFKQEFRSLADISHPNLASLYELISLDGAWWLAMEFVDGVDLLSYVGGTRGQAAPASTSDDEETSATPVPRGRRRDGRRTGLARRDAPSCRLRTATCERPSSVPRKSAASGPPSPNWQARSTRCTPTTRCIGTSSRPT